MSRSEVHSGESFGQGEGLLSGSPRHLVGRFADRQGFLGGLGICEVLYGLILRRRGVGFSRCGSRHCSVMASTARISLSRRWKYISVS